MTQPEVLALIEEGLNNGRITPQTAAYIAAEVLGVAAFETGYHDWDREDLSPVLRNEPRSERWQVVSA